MSSSERYERRLPVLLEELAAPRTPDYFDDILGQVDRTRQRPGWAFPERWLPMSAVSERLATAPRVPMRAVLAAALLLIALAVGLALITGSQRPKVPAPFGPALNGQVAFVDDTGAILAGDPATGTSRVIVSGAGHQRPVFSPDGTRLAFLQTDQLGNAAVVVADADGRQPRVISDSGLLSVGHVGWSADGRRVVVAIPPNTLAAFDADRTGPPTTLSDAATFDGAYTSFDDFNAALADLYRPPNGDEFLYLGDGAGGGGLYRQAVAGGTPIAILTSENSPFPLGAIVNPQWSPDGSKIAVTINLTDHPSDFRVFVMNADGSDLHELLSNPTNEVVSQQSAAWSPDGTSIAMQRWVREDDCGPCVARPITIVDVATGAAHEVGPVSLNGYRGWSWSPDGSSILAIPQPVEGEAASGDSDRVLIVDAATGVVTRPGWTSPAGASWQRQAP